MLSSYFFYFLISRLPWSSSRVGLCGIAVDKSERTLEGVGPPAEHIDLAQVFGRRAMEGDNRDGELKKNERDR